MTLTLGAATAGWAGKSPRLPSGILARIFTPWRVPDGPVAVKPVAVKGYEDGDWTSAHGGVRGAGGIRPPTER